MPQDKQRRPNVVEAYERRRRERRPSVVEAYEQRQARREAPAQEPEGVFSSFQTGVAGPLLRNVIETAADFYNAPGETLERVGRGALEFASAFDPAGNAYEATVRDQAARVAELNRRADERLPEFVKSAKVGMALEEAKPRTRAGRIAGAVGSVLGEAAFPLAPETAAGNIVMAPFGASAARSAGKFVAPVLQRIRAGRAAGAAPQADDLAEAAIRSQGGLPRLEADLGVSAAPSASARASGASASVTGPRPASANFSLAADDLAAIGRAGEELATRAERTKLLEVVSAARKAGLLTSVKTHIKNVAGTGGFQLSEELARIPGAIVDTLVSRVTKQRTLTGPSLASMRRSAQEAATKGWSEAKEIWRNGITQADIERLGLNQEINSGSKILDAYINKTFRALSVEDKLLHTYATRRALEDRARALALTEMRQGKIPRGDVGKRTLEILDAPPEDLAAAAIADGEIAVFTNENLVSKFLAGGRKEIEKLPGGRAATFGLDLVFPFTKTPTNVIARMLDYAGLGAAKESTRAVARRIVGKSMTEAQQRQFATQWGRASVGAGLVALGYIGYKNGWLTGFIEDDLSRRERDEASGRIPGAILIGGRWHQILGAAPLASLMVIGATLGREVDQEREGSSGLLPALETVGQAVSEQPLLIGTKQVGEAVTKPGTTGERLLGGLAGSFVPTFVSDVAEAVDPLQRDTRGAGILGAAQKRIPGARNFLPEAQDVLGRPRQDRGPAGALLDPTRATADATRDNVVLRELVRLDVGLSGVNRREGESAAEHRARIQEFGRLYTVYGAALVSDPQYNLASDKTKREALAALNRKLKSLLGEDEGQAGGKLSAPAVLDSVRRSEERRREKERKQGR